jgi:hypothetical protein
VDLPHCLQLSTAMNRAARGVRDALLGRPALWSRVRGIDFAESLEGRDLVALLDTEMDAGEAAGLGALAEGAPALTGLGAVAGGRYLSLRGAPHVHSTLAGIPLRAHIRSFFQANRFLVEPLLRTVADLVPAGGTVLDLYAGIGFFSLSLAPRAGDVLAIEGNPTAVEDAVFNVAQAGLTNVRILEVDVGEGLAMCTPRPGERILLDPPRTGAGPGVVRAIAARRPEVVVYVSCDPPTLGRDLAAFAGEGFRPDAVQAFDLFPDTFHLETVARLVRA